MHPFKVIILWAAAACLLLHFCDTTSAATIATDDNVAATTDNTALNPIILVPGLGGSQMEYCVKKPKHPCSCQNSHCWNSLWIAPIWMWYDVYNWADKMQLTYDKETHTTLDNDKIKVRVPGFGNTDNIEYLVAPEFPMSNYFMTMTTRLRTLGYESGVNMHGAPYDFRRAPNEHGQYFAELKSLVENTYARNGNKTVIFICHSMGSPMMLYFLNRQTQAWKDKYIKAFISLAGVWGGTMKALEMYVEGNTFGQIGIIDTYGIQIVERTTPSLAWLMPSERLWKPDEVLYQREKLNLSITVSNYNDFYESYNHTDGLMMYEDTKDLIKDLTPPGVETFCLHSSGMSTTEKLLKEMDDEGYESLDHETGDGDGTVNLRSLQACTEWEGKQKQKFHHKVFPKLDHMRMMHNSTVLDYVQNIVQEMQDKSVASHLPEIEIL